MKSFKLRNHFPPFILIPITPTETDEDHFVLSFVKLIWNSVSSAKGRRETTTPT